jgi:hypothetical protein
VPPLSTERICHERASRCSNRRPATGSHVPPHGAPHADASAYAKKFAGKYEHREITGGIGHNLPQEAPRAFAQAIVDADGWAT